MANTGIFFDFSKKVDVKADHSLLADSEIARLATLSNYDDTEVKGLIAQETANRSSAITTAVAAEADARSAKDTDIEGRVSDVETNKLDKSTYNTKVAALEAADTDMAGDISDNAAAIATLNGDNTTAGSVAKAVKDATDAEASARSEADAALQDAIDDITEQLGGSGEGGASLTSRIADLEAATVVATSKDLPILENGQINDDYMPVLKFQGQEVGKLAKEIDIIGIGNVSVDPVTGKIQLRLGENLNCCVWNGTDGISTTTVSSVKSDDVAGIVSGDYSAVSATGSKHIFYGTAKITAKAGTTATTAAGATKANGNEVHFNDDATGYFLVNIKEGTSAEVTTYRVGPITGDATLTGTLNGVAVSGISCAIANFGEEPKKASGATGYSGCVNFTFTPANIFSESKDFQLVSIEQVNIADAGLETETITSVSTWTNTATNGVYFYLKENTVKPGTPSAVSYDFASVITKKISGVTYITTTSTFKVSASGLTNLGYPVADGTYVKVATSGDVWFKGFTNSGTGTLTTYTTQKDATMSFESAAVSPYIGKWSAPEVKVTGHNLIGDGTGLASTKGIDLLVCDTNGYVTSSHGSFAGSEELAEGELAVYDGRLVYPTAIAVSGYNEDVIADLEQPDYSGVIGPRSYTKVFDLAGGLTGGTITLEHTASIETAINNGSLKVEYRTSSGTFKDLAAGGDVNLTAATTYGTTSSTLVFQINKPADYPTGTSDTAIRITMSSAVAEIKNITLA